MYQLLNVIYVVKPRVNIHRVRVYIGILKFPPPD